MQSLRIQNMSNNQDQRWSAKLSGKLTIVGLIGSIAVIAIILMSVVAENA